MRYFNNPNEVVDTRFSILYDFDVKRSNPQGDPDMDNAPRIDSFDMKGLVSGAGLKRKIRDYIIKKVIAGELDPKRMGVHVARQAVLNRAMEDMCKKLDINVPKGQSSDSSEEDIETQESDTKKAKGKKAKSRISGADADRLSRGMTADYFDVRAFGGVLSVGVGGNNVNGPIQFSWSESVDPVEVISPTFTRVAVTNEEQAEKQDGRNRGMAQVPFVRYGLYRCEINVAPFESQKTGFTFGDLELMLEALWNMHEVSRASGRSQINARRITVFQHQKGSIAGSARDCQLFPLSKYTLRPGTDSPSCYEDYSYNLDDENLPEGVSHWEYNPSASSKKKIVAA